MKKLVLILVLVFGLQITYAQTKEISGKVTSASDGLGIPGVSVAVKGTTIGVSTNLDGSYTLQVPSNARTLVFSFVGMTSEEVLIGGKSIINVVLKSEATALEQVVVTALGIKRKPKEMSYSTAKVKSEDLIETKSTNVATAMVGKVSGLQINTVNNGVNPSTRIVLRGSRSLLGNNQALIVIDGYPASRGALDRLNTSDIADINVLKGANASALYGSEAANGVLIVTTKKGQGKLNVQISSNLIFEQVAYLPELQEEFGAGGFPDGTLYPLENVAWGPRFDPELMVDASETLDNGEVWQVPYAPIKNRNRDFFDTGITTRNGITLSSGDATGDFLLSIDHANVSGTLPRDRYNRTNFRFKASKTYDKLTIGANVSFFRSYYNTVSNDAGRQGRPVYWNLLNTPLHLPLDQMKNWKTGKFTRNEVSFFRFYENPYFIIDTQRNNGQFRDFTVLGDAEYKFTDWFSALFKVGYTGTSSLYKKEFGAYDYDFHLEHTYSEMDPYGASTSDNVSTGTRVNTDFMLKFEKDLSSDFSSRLIVGHNMRLREYKIVDVSGENLIIPDFYNVSTRTGELIGSEYTEEERKLGVYGDLTLGYRDFVFLNATARNDWSSTLPKENRSFFYPGVGISFVASSAFPEMLSDNGLSYLKLSANITKTGNNTTPYRANDIFYAPDNFPYASTPGLSQTNEVSDPELSPEFTTSKEVGLEFALFRSRLSGSITAYQTNTTDQLVAIDISTAAGASRYFTNIGEIENKGIELDLNGTLVKSGLFAWDLGFNYSGFDSEVISLKEGVDELDIGGYTAAQVVAKVGEPYPLLRTTSYLRDDQGRVVVDDTGDPIQSSKDLIQGKTTPDYILGFNTRLTYGNFSLYAVADYRTGHIFYNSIVDALEFTGLTKHSATSGRQPFVFPNSSYQDANGNYVENTNRLTSGAGNAFWDEYNEVKENYITDATTLKLREVSLRYNFAGYSILENVGIKSIELGVYGKNLLTLRPAENVYTDPEFNFTTGNAVGVGTQAQTPPTRQYGFNLTLKF